MIKDELIENFDHKKTLTKNHHTTYKEQSKKIYENSLTQTDSRSLSN